MSMYLRVVKILSKQCLALRCSPYIVFFQSQNFVKLAKWAANRGFNHSHFIVGQIGIEEGISEFTLL